MPVFSLLGFQCELTNWEFWWQFSSQAQQNNYYCICDHCCKHRYILSNISISISISTVKLSVTKPNQVHTKWYQFPIWVAVRKSRKITAVDFGALHLIRWLSTAAHFRCTDSWTDYANVLFNYREVIQSGIFTHRAHEKCEITHTTWPWSLPRLLSR